MADPKQRYQSPGLGDTLRLQNFVLSNSLPAQVRTVAKVEIFQINDAFKSPNNPRGLVLQETIVNNQGANPRIFPHPQALNADYWETQIQLVEDEYKINDYIDRWHLILDPDYDLENPIARKPSSQFTDSVGGNDWSGLGWVGTVGSGSAVANVDIGGNRAIVENGINDSSGTEITVSDALAAITTSAINTSGLFEPTGLISSIGTVVGSIITDFTGNAGQAHTGGTKVAYFSLTSGDNGVSWTGTLIGNTNVPLADRPTGISATYNSATNILSITVTWGVGDEPTSMKIVPVFVDKWITTIDYNPNQSNPWDDLIQRTSSSLVAVADLDFKIHPVLWQSSAAPIVSDYDWLVNPTQVYLDTTQWMRITIEPRVPDNPESIRLHYAYLASGKLRYELFRIQDDGQKLRLIKQDTIDWHAENKGLFKIDTSRAPLNRAQDCYIIFYVDLPDGSTIRSPRITVSIQDDRISFFRNVQDRTAVF